MGFVYYKVANPKIKRVLFIKNNKLTYSFLINDDFFGIPSSSVEFLHKSFLLWQRKDSQSC